MNPPLLMVAHGSRDLRSAATVRQLAGVVRERAAGVDVRVAFLELSEPSVPRALAALHAEGHREVVVAPLLLGAAYHARVDLPGLVSEARAQRLGLAITVADVLGPDQLLQQLALNQAASVAGGKPAGVVLTGVGSSDAAANATVKRIATTWQARGHFAGVRAAFATCEPSVSDSINLLRAAGLSRIVLSPWFLAPGLLLDRVIEQARRATVDVRVAAPLGAHVSVADVVIARYASATRLARAA